MCYLISYKGSQVVPLLPHQQLCRVEQSIIANRHKRSTSYKQLHIQCYIPALKSRVDK